MGGEVDVRPHLHGGGAQHLHCGPRRRAATRRLQGEAGRRRREGHRAHRVGPPRVGDAVGGTRPLVAPYSFLDPELERGGEVDVFEAIRKRKAVRSYTDRPVADEVLDKVLRAALSAPTGSGSQAWGLLVVRDDAKRREIADLIIAGGATYFAAMRPMRDATPEEHEKQCVEYAEQILPTYRIAPVWVLGLLVPRNNYPEAMAEGGYVDDLLSIAFAMENLFVAARAEGLGTVPTSAFQRFEKDRLRQIVGLPDEVDPVLVTPLGYPESFPEGLPPALKRTYRGWKSLVHDDAWGNTRD
ncbi:MAG: nitroreductase family protein [Actinobacteria bacterium]|nr:nitroreductase family protein [Actinomycetota bacterium]